MRGQMQGSGIKEYPNCFGCGQENPKGLGLKLRLEGDTLVTEFVPRPEHEGWPGIVSGGIILALLYEVLENQPYYAGDTPMMKCIETRLLCPAHVGESIRATAWEDSRTEREVCVSAAITNSELKVIAEASATLVILNDDQKERLGIN